jgi:hypothetical protein
VLAYRGLGLLSSKGLLTPFLDLSSSMRAERLYPSAEETRALSALAHAISSALKARCRSLPMMMAPMPVARGNASAAGNAAEENNKPREFTRYADL